MDTKPAADIDDRYARDYWRRPSEVQATLPALAADNIDATQFQLLADNLPTLCWIANGDGFIVWYNRRWHEYCGTTPAAMEGWGWQDVHDPEQLPEVMARWTAAITTGQPFEMVFPLRGADGVFRPFLTRIVPLRDASDQIVRWFGVNTEIGAQLRAETARDRSEAKYTVLTEAMPQMVWSTRSDGHHDYYNAQWYEFTGAPLGSTDGAAWNGLFHSDDRERAWARWRHSLATGEPYEIEYRLRHHSGEYRWALGRALPVRDERGRIIRWIGTCTDIHVSKLAATQTEILGQELSHRIKNIFAIITGLIRLSMRRDPAAKTFALQLLGRIIALGRAHEFARPHSDESRPQTVEMLLQGLLIELFRPYSDAGEEPRIVVAGDNAEVDDKGATPLALLFHELATNATKYGALSNAEGRVQVNIVRRGEELTLVWRETGGPPVAGEPKRQGFGTQLTAMSVEQQLGGTLHREWLPQGLQVTVVLKRSRLARLYAVPSAPVTA